MQDTGARIGRRRKKQKDTGRYFWIGSRDVSFWIHLCNALTIYRYRGIGTFFCRQFPRLSLGPLCIGSLHIQKSKLSEVSLSFYKKGRKRWLYKRKWQNWVLRLTLTLVIVVVFHWADVCVLPHLDIEVTLWTYLQTCEFSLCQFAHFCPRTIVS